MSYLQWLSVGAAAFSASIVLTGICRHFALRAQLVDIPNARSSHATPTPRGGGLAIVSVSVVMIVAGGVSGVIDGRLAMALSGGGIAVAAVGFCDDRFNLSARIRFIVHVAAALWAMVCLQGVPPFPLGGHIVEPGVLGYVAGTLAIVWVLNLFNFMDGIDGIAAAEAGFVCLAGAAIAAALVQGSSTAVAATLIGLASLGFLPWNWSPARIFMGDVGSGYLGYSIAVLALAAMHENAVGFPVWFVLGAVFFVDATVTLLRRASRRETLHLAHRSHGYQWLSRRWKSHMRVTGAIALINGFWLLPCAGFLAYRPALAGVTVIVAFVPVVVLALVVGSGRREDN